MVDDISAIVLPAGGPEFLVQLFVSHEVVGDFLLVLNAPEYDAEEV